MICGGYYRGNTPTIKTNRNLRALFVTTLSISNDFYSQKPEARLTLEFDEISFQISLGTACFDYSIDKVVHLKLRSVS